MRFTSLLTASAIAALTTAQTFTKCNPMEKDCPNDPAMAATFETDFTKGADAVKGWKMTNGVLAYSKEGAQFTINKKNESPTMQSETYLHFGYVEVKCKAAPGQGIISSVILQSEDLDEVDWEFIGGTNTEVQMNYFGKGNTTVFDRMIPGPVSNPQQEMHTYALDWTAEKLTWIIDGKPIRTLNYADANGGKNYPQTPATVRIGIWAGGDPDLNNEGTVEWAGGKTDYSKAPFTMTLESVKIKNYSPGKEYKWTDKTGSYQSIEVIGKGDTEGAPQNSAVLAPSASVSASGDALNSQVNNPGATKTAGVGAPQGGNGTDSSCSCGVATVTVTGPSPPPASAPATSQTTLVPLPSTATSLPPAITVPPVSSPPYPTTGSSSGLVTDTNAPPSVPFPTGGAPGGGNATTSAPPQFTGAASSNKAGAFVGMVAAAALLII